MSSTRSVLLPALALLAAGCSPPTQQVDLAAEREALLQTDREFSELSRQSGAAAAFAEYLVPDALGLPAGSQPLFHRDSLVTRLAGDFTLIWDPQRAEVSASADMGWTWGRYESHSAGPDGAVQVGHGKYLNVWRKEPDGTWRVVADIGNANPPPGE